MTHDSAVVGTASPITSIKPVILDDGGDRGADLHVKVSAPVAGNDLPIVLLSHGFGSSGEMYQPLADFWASHGFVVLQPTYLDSRTLGLSQDDHRAPHYWRHRLTDAVRVLDNLDVLISALPGLAARVDAGTVAVAGHSFGGQTSGLLLGLRVLAPAADGEDYSDPRVKAGILLATAGLGGNDLSPGMIDKLPWLNVSFEHMTAPALVVLGDKDQSILTTRGPDWSADPYHYAPGPKSLLTLAGAEHSLGGVVGYDSFETTDGNPAAVALVQRLTTAYLRTNLGVDRDAWATAATELHQDAAAPGTLESK